MVPDELEATSFDWYCEQGHVGLERVAMARRDPALREPVTAAVERLRAIYARLKGDESVLGAARENLLLPVSIHPPTGTIVGGVPRERAYRDALLDLAAPAMGYPPVVRIAALNRP